MGKRRMRSRTCHPFRPYIRMIADSAWKASFSQDGYKEHRAKHAGAYDTSILSYACTKCDAKFPTGNRLSIHQFQEHGRKATRKPVPRDLKFRCHYDGCEWSTNTVCFIFRCLSAAELTSIILKEMSCRGPLSQQSWASID